MTDDELEQRLRTWYRAEVGDTTTGPVELRTRVDAIPKTWPVVERRLVSRRGTVLLAAAMMLGIGGAIAVGAGILGPAVIRPPSLPTQRSVAVTQVPSPHPGSSSPLPSGPTGPTGGGLILAETWKTLYDRDRHDVVAIDPDTSTRTVLGSFPGGGANPSRFEWTADRSQVLVVDSGMEAAISLESPSVTSPGFEFLDAAEINSSCCQGGSMESIVLSPRGDRIAAVHVDGFETKIAVVIFDANGGGLKSLPVPKGMDFFGGLSWAPDESALVAYGCRPCNKAQTPTEHQTPFHGHLYVIPLDGSPWRELLDVDNGFVSARWSPDGTTFATTTSICASGRSMPRCDFDSGRTSLGTIPVDGGAPTTIAEGPSLRGVTWGPDGHQIAYRTTNGLFVVNVGGSKPVRIDDGDGGDPDWSPDGRWLLFSRTPIDLWIVPAAGGEPRQIGTGLAGAAW